LTAGDESIVIVYDSTENSAASVHAAVEDGTETALADASALVQLVEAA
jgi:hypothetical protein